MRTHTLLAKEFFPKSSLKQGTSLCSFCGDRGPEPGFLLASPDDCKDMGSFFFLPWDEKHKARSSSRSQGPAA